MRLKLLRARFKLCVCCVSVQPSETLIFLCRFLRRRARHNCFTTCIAKSRAYFNVFLPPWEVPTPPSFPNTCARVIHECLCPVIPEGLHHVIPEGLCPVIPEGFSRESVCCLWIPAFAHCCPE